MSAGPSWRGSVSPERVDLSALLPVLDSLLPRELVPIFDEPFVRSCLLYEEYVHRLTIEVFVRSGLARAAEAPGTAADLMTRAGLDPVPARVPVLWMLRDLAARGLLGVAGEEGDAAAVYHLRPPLPSPDPEGMLEAQRAVEASWIPAYTVARTAATDYPEFLAGRMTGEEILFSPSRLGLWFEYFTNENGLYRVNNRVGAIAADLWAAGPGVAVLELGGGLGSAAEAFLEHFRDRGRLPDLTGYRFTELVPAFLRRGQRRLSERFADLGVLSFGKLDMDKPFGEQGVAPGSVTLVYAVNTLHVARDLAFTLGEIRSALAPGGRLVLSECVKPSPTATTYVEFIFNLMETFRSPKLDPRTRPSGGFLSPEHWTLALETAGFGDVRFLPDIQRVQRHISVFYVAAVGATRAD